MIRDYYEEICAGHDVRQNLIALRSELKDDAGKRAFAYLLAGDFQVLTDLLQAEDPKIRKNAALILGEMETEDILPFLFAAYQKEQTLFVRTDYLKAMEKSEYRPYLEKLKTRLHEMNCMEVTEENRKHFREETRQLQNMILRYEKPKKHVFAAYEPAPDVILMTNRCQINVTQEQIRTGEVSAFGQGVRVKKGNMKELLAIRTVQEILLTVPGARAMAADADQIGNTLAALHLEDYLDALHKTGGIFLYRIEIKGPMAQDKKGRFIRRIAEILDQKSNGLLKNHISEYEVEIRLLERKDGTFLPMLKLFTLPDRRFDYRQEVVASSIAPVNAALTVQLALPYLKEGAQILDPFCGVGTMLIERNKAVKATPMYGLDIFGEAIEKARINTKRDGSVINYINRDFFDFTHDYLFDEIITDMPRSNRPGEDPALITLYMRFFERARTLLKKEAVMVLYTMNPELVYAGVRRDPAYQIREEYMINEKNKTKVFVITVKN